MATEAVTFPISAQPNLLSVLSARGKMKSESPDGHTCLTCHKKLPQISENLLKDSLRMKSEIAQLSSQRKSLMSMLALNEDFAYSLSPFGKVTRTNTPHSRAATSSLINQQRYNSVMGKYAEVMRNRGLHDCEKLHTHSRKHEYKRWDFSHADLAKYSDNKNPLAARKVVPNIGWENEECADDVDDSSDESSESEIKELREEERSVHADINASRVTARTGRTTLTHRTRPPSQDDEENIPEEERVQNTMDKIRRARKGGMLAEIQLIKDRHQQLEVLTQAKRRAAVETRNTRRIPKKSGEKKQEDILKRFLLANANLQKELDFNKFKEKTTIEMNRNFTDTATKLHNPGVVWASKWSTNKGSIPGKIHKSTHPVSDARKGTRAFFKPAVPGFITTCNTPDVSYISDIPPCVYLPKHIDNKIPVESAYLLDRFMKETIEVAATGNPVGVLPLPDDELK